MSSFLKPVTRAISSRKIKDREKDQKRVKIFSSFSYRLLPLVQPHLLSHHIQEGGLYYVPNGGIAGKE